MFDALLQRGFEIETRGHARAILEVDFADVTAELLAVLATISIPIEEIIGGGGGETPATGRLRRALDERGWHPANYDIATSVNGQRRLATGLEVSHVRSVAGIGSIACEIEWNTKDSYFDRDLETFRRLHAEGAISVGVLITRGRSLNDGMVDLVRRFADDNRLAAIDDVRALGLNPTPRQVAAVARRLSQGDDFADAWSRLFCADKFGQATSHWKKLEDRIRRGVGSPCPLLCIGLPRSAVAFDTGSRLGDSSDAEPEFAFFD